MTVLFADPMGSAGLAEQPDQLRDLAAHAQRAAPKEVP
jgi:hypothetical protein